MREWRTIRILRTGLLIFGGIWAGLVISACRPPEPPVPESVSPPAAAVEAVISKENPSKESRPEDEEALPYAEKRNEASDMPAVSPEARPESAPEARLTSGRRGTEPPFMPVPPGAAASGAARPDDGRSGASSPAAAPGTDSSEILPEIADTDAPADLPTLPLTLDIMDVPLTELLRTLAGEVGLSIIFSHHIQGKVSLAVRNKPWDAVFHSLLSAHGLTCRRTDGILRILAAQDLQTDIQRLELVARQRKHRLALEDTGGFPVRIFPVRYADGKSLEDIFSAYLDKDGGEKKGFVLRDSYSNSLIVRASSRDLRLLAGLMAALDRPSHQVRIEARIVEASDDAARELGMEWGGYWDTGNGVAVSPGLVSSSGVSSSSASADTAKTASGQADGAGSVSLSGGLMQQFTQTVSGAAGLSIGLFRNLDAGRILGAQLSALETEGRLNIISSPSITTLNHHTAVIESGEEVPYQTVEDDEVAVEFRSASLKLEVTPHVIEGRLIKMDLATFKDELDFSNRVQGNPVVLTKRATATVLLRNGETTVIAGLRRRVSNEAEEGVPFLKDIPLIGPLFRLRNSSNRKEEVMIFITPRILPPPEMPAPLQGEAS